MTNNTEKAFYSIMLNNINYELGGWENSVSDGEMTQEECDKLCEKDVLIESANDMLKYAYEIGHLEKENSFYALEAKHIKFLGNERIQKLIELAVNKALESY